MRRFGLIGYPLGHSFSRKYFMDKFRKENLDCQYDNFPLLNISELSSIISRDKTLEGLNITLPYKIEAIKYLDKIDNDAQLIGSVNVIKINRSGENYSLHGYNTDVFGFIESVRPVLNDKVSSALIMGCGGASLAVRAGLNRLGLEYTTVSRDADKGDMQYSDIGSDTLIRNKLIINASPVGMYPATEEAPAIPYDLLSDDNILFDLVYNPEMTMFMRRGEERGCSVKGGLEMLYLQAEKAWEVWNSED